MDWMFDAWDSACKRPFGAVASETRVRFAIYPPRSEGVRRAALLVQQEGGTLYAAEMGWLALEDGRDVYSCEITAGEPGLYFYRFELETACGTRMIARQERAAGNAADGEGEPFQLTVFDPAFETPGWLKGGVFYQVFPDRFCREGDFPKELPAGRTLLEWGAPLPDGGARGKAYRADCYYGGNLAGIEAKLPYLKALGVTALYLNPIFESHAYHRYHTADYARVDPLLGDEADFARLCERAEDAGIRVVLDGVFSHTGADSVYFNREGRYPGPGAFQSKESPYFAWYDFKNWPDEYRCWWDMPDLPEVNEEEPSYLEYITGEGGIAQKWLRGGAAGWRLDVADELPDAFLTRLRARLKQTDPASVLYGEVWEDASNKISYGQRRHYLEGAQLDSVMNYPWRAAILDFLRGGDAAALETRVVELLEHYPKPAADLLMNLLGSHDTPRLLTALADPRGRAPLPSLPAEPRACGLALAKLGSALQFFLPGVPCVYYGDEAGMEGGADPLNRLCFPWGGGDAELTDWYRRLGALRAACPVLREGGLRRVAAGEGLFAFARAQGQNPASSGALPAGSLLCAVNLGAETRLRLPDLAPGFGFALRLEQNGARLEEGELALPPASCAVLTAKASE